MGPRKLRWGDGREQGTGSFLLAGFLSSLLGNQGMELA